MLNIKHNTLTDQLINDNMVLAAKLEKQNVLIEILMSRLESKIKNRKD